MWVDVAEVDIDHHVRNVTLPAPGTLRQLLDLATEPLVQPFDRDAPVWEFLAVDGLADGQGAVIQKMHHTITDGENGIKLSLQFLDLERHGTEPPPLTRRSWTPRRPSRLRRRPTPSWRRSATACGSAPGRPRRSPS